MRPQWAVHARVLCMIAASALVGLLGGLAVYHFPSNAAGPNAASRLGRLVVGTPGDTVDLSRRRSTASDTEEGVYARAVRERSKQLAKLRSFGWQPSTETDKQDGSDNSSASADSIVEPVAAADPSLSYSDTSLRFPLWWMGPIWSGSGYGSEAVNFALSLFRSGLVAKNDVWVSNSGDNWNWAAVESMHKNDVDELGYMEKLVELDINRSPIVVCHSMPPGWAAPQPMHKIEEKQRCPPNADQHKPLPAYTVARTMCETDRIPRSFAERCNYMNEVWVPSEASKQAFIDSGVAADKILIVPEGINTSEYDPQLFAPLTLPCGEQVFGGNRVPGREPFVFLSTFKWEARKGWDVLLSAFLSEFTSQDDAELYILTKPFMSKNSDFKTQMRRWVNETMSKSNATRPASSYPRLYVISHHVKEDELMQFYRAANAFVLPSRGEGWGRPHVEAMSMGLPVLATNWSGVTAYLNDRVGYPISIEGLVPAEGAWWFNGYKWAQPSVAHFRQTMRHVVTHRAEAAAKGRAARQHMIDNYSPEVLSMQLWLHVKRIEAILVKKALNETALLK